MSAQRERQSLFFRDLASPIASSRRSGGGGGRGGASTFATPGQAAAVSALWRENFGVASDPPPPPVFTLDDRSDFSPDSGLPPLSPMAITPTPPPPSRSAAAVALAFSSPSPFRAGGPGAAAAQVEDPPPKSPRSAGWWSAARSGEEKPKVSSPVDGVVQPGALITLPPPREVARPELQRNSLPSGGLDEEEWVTVYGFPPGDTNLVLREFEKFGVITKHIPGPRDANWMHILYQNRYDAQKALGKNGMQINSVLIIGVKPVDPAQRQFLDDNLNGTSYGGFMIPLPPQPAATRRKVDPLGASPRPNYQQNGNVLSDSRHPSAGAIASPAKSVVSKVMDLMFGI